MVDPRDRVFPAESQYSAERGVELRTWLAAQCFPSLAARFGLEVGAEYAVKAADRLIQELNK